MGRVLNSLTLLALLILGAASSLAEAPRDAPPRVRLETSHGVIVLQLYPEKAPGTVENFLAYVHSGHYEDTLVYRVESFLIQMGSIQRDLQSRPVREPIPNEADNGLRNARGTVGMARWEPHSATAEFYINLKDNPHLDFREKTEAGWGYCVFGKVVAGMEVVETIAALPTEARGQLHALPQETVLLHRVSPVDPEP